MCYDWLKRANGSNLGRERVEEGHEAEPRTGWARFYIEYGWGVVGNCVMGRRQSQALENMIS